MSIRPSKEELEKYSVDYSKDTDFSAFARLLQSKWRHEKGFEPLKYGNFIEVDFAKKSKSNFLTDNTKQIVETTVAKGKKEGALISEPRIWNNLLSSQPLCFNLFAELSVDMNLATKFFKILFPETINVVNKILFEYSPKRKSTEYTGDSSAFDVFVEYSNNKNETCFLGIEVKYAESLKEETKIKAQDNFTNHKSDYERLTTNDYFITDAISDLQKVPLAQIWRDHLLAISMMHHSAKKYSEGSFVFLFPKQNSHCQKGVDDYQTYLVKNNSDKTKVGFYPMYLEKYIETLLSIYPNADNEHWTRELKKRYLGN